MWLTISTGNTQELPNPTYDLMHWIQEAPDDHSIVLNSWDWEFLRQQFEKLPSTGPTGPFLWWRNLEGHDLLPILAVGKNEDGRQLVVVIGGDRALYYRREGQLEGSWDPWSSLGGKELQQPVRVAVGATGEVVVFVLGGDRKVYCRSQVGPNGAWADWTNIGGEGIRGDFAVARNTDGRLEIVAVWNDGALHNVSQSAPDGSWGAWTSRGGHDLAGAVGLAANADGRLAAFAVGGDGIIYYQWQLNVNGQTGWSDWNTLNKIEKNVTSLPKSERVLVIGGNDGRLYVFLMKNDHQLAYQVQSAPNATGQDWTSIRDLTGPLLMEPSAIWPCTVALNPDGRLEVFLAAQDRHVYNQWQVDAERPDVWSDWVNLGGRDLSPTLGIGRDDGGELNLFVIGGDKKLYFSDRGGIEPDRPEPWQVRRVRPLLAREVTTVHEGTAKVLAAGTQSNPRGRGKKKKT